jgi:hypothetical protein
VLAQVAFHIQEEDFSFMITDYKKGCIFTKNCKNPDILMGMGIILMFTVACNEK